MVDDTALGDGMDREVMLYRARQAEHQVWLLKQKREKQKIWIWQIALLAGFLIIWELAAQFGWIDAFLFSCPSAVVKIFWQYFSSGSIWTHIGIPSRS